MSGIHERSDARRALIEKYLHTSPGELQQAAHTDDSTPQAGRGERVVVIQHGGSQRPFFYLHGDWRGQALYCYPLAQALGPDQPFYVLEPYMFEDLSIPPPLETIAKVHLEALRRVQPHGPYLLGGWCNGGLIAYEIARQLHEQGETIDLLVLMDGMLPGRHKLVRTIISRLGLLFRVSQEKQIDWFILVHYVYRWVRFPKYRGRTIAELAETNRQDEPGQQRPGLLQAWAAVKALRQTYSGIFEWITAGYTPSLYPGKITFFWVASSATAFTREWRQVLTQKRDAVEIHTLPGNDITSRTEHLPIFAEHLRACVKQAQAEKSH